MHNFAGHEAIINTLSMNEEGVMFSGGKSDHPVIRSRVDSDLADNGTLTMWDYATGLPFQHLKDIPQPGSLDAEAVSGLQFYFGRIADVLVRASSVLPSTKRVLGSSPAGQIRPLRYTQSKRNCACRVFPSGIFKRTNLPF